MHVYIIRHAWAEDRGDEWPDDRLRLLTKAGMKRFAKVASRLADNDVVPKVIATSPLVRCRQTAEILADELDEEPEVIELAALEPGSDLESLLEWTASQSGDVAWVGHAPDVGQLAAALIGDGRAHIRFAKGACSAVRFYEQQVALGEGELQWHVTAKLLGV